MTINDLLSKRFAANVKLRCERKKISQGVLANKAGLTQGYVSLILSGTRTPTLETCSKIAAALEIAPEHLFKEAK